ncbi:MAG TPA: dihydroorotase [Acidimicrobiales bacterium]|nr:dihydroorotase [Acidimicrobiales bacterium]
MADRRRTPAVARHATVMVRGGTVVDETGERRADVVITDGVVTAVGPGLEVPTGATVLDAVDCLVAPGLVDLHTHLRQPGGEEAETVETASRAAARGGYTAVVGMPNTNPPIDNAAVALEVLGLGEPALCRVAVAGAITVGRAGECLAPMGELAALGVRLFTDDGTGVQDSGVMRRALEYARGLGVTLGQHCEDGDLAAGGHMHEGAWSSRLGVPGVPAAAEELMVARDIMLARLTGGRVHFLHLSTAGSLALVATAKAEGLPVTAEVAPHHLALTDAELAGYDTVFKVNPPLRTETDVAALRAGCAAGTVDAVATDHAPHPSQAKDGPLDTAAPGMLGLETAVAVTLQALGAERDGMAEGDGNGAVPPTTRPGAAASMTVGDVLALMSWRPARIAGLSVEQGGDQGGPIAVGMPGNLCVIDPAERWEVDPDRLASRSRNTPWAGRTLIGRVRHTVYRGEPVVVGTEAQR